MESRTLHKRPGVDFLPTRRPYAAHLELPASGCHGKTCLIDGRHRAQLASSGARKLLGIEQLHGRAVIRGPSTRLRIRTTDEVPYLLERLLPVNLNVFLFTP